MRNPYRLSNAALSHAFLGLLAAVVLTLSGCRPKAPSDAPGEEPNPYATAEDEFSVMTYNLLRYSLQDRDYDGQEDDKKPQEEVDAVLDVIVAENPDVIAVQEVGRTNIFESLRADLAARGLVYEFSEHLQHADNTYNLAVLSRLPIVSHQSRLDYTYSIGKRTRHVARGFIDVDISVNPAYTFKLVVAHLKSKLFHEAGQTEMRRNEARLLNKHVRDAIKNSPRMNILVVGDMNDTYGSKAIREITGEEKRVLIDLRPEDTFGDAWTHFRRSHDEYARIDYTLVNEAMLSEVVAEKTHVVRRPETAIASDHRPVVAVFKARDLPAAKDE